MVLVEDLISKYGKNLNLKPIAGLRGVDRVVKGPEVQRPGLALSGYLKNYVTYRILILGLSEVSYLCDLEKDLQIERLKGVITKHTPAVIVARHSSPPEQLIAICEKGGIPLYCTEMHTMDLQSKLTLLLREEFSPILTAHGTLLDVFGMGMLIQGDSSVGKSEAALGLIERGHRLISDDIVRIRVREGTYLEGSGPELTRHLMEIRGIGIINVAHLYGAVCVRDEKSLDLIVKLETWDDTHEYDRVGLEEKYSDMLGIKVPFHVLPLKPGRDVVLLLETIALNNRLKGMGYNSAKEFNHKLLETIAKRQKESDDIMQSQKKGSKIEA